MGRQTELTQNTGFFKKLLLLGLPILFQNLIASSLNYLDVIMVGQLGEVQVAAVGIANQIYFIFIMIVFGISSGSAIFAAQYWGQKDIASIRSVLGIGYVCSTVIVGIFTLGTLLFTEFLIGLFSKDPEVIRLGSRYLWIVGISYPFTMVTVLLGTVLRSTEEVVIPMISNILGLAINTVFNFLLIFGYLGFPAMGVDGAAIATLSARVLGMVFMIAMVYGKKHAAAAGIKELLSFTRQDFMNYLKAALPVVIQNLAWSAGSSMYTLVYGRMGTSSVAAVNVVGSVERFSIMFFSAIGHAARTMIGNRIGAGEYDLARRFGRYFLMLGIGASLVFMAGIIPVRSILVGIYNLSPESIVFAEALMLVMALGLIAKAGNIMLMMGTLQSGGDTLFCMLVDTVGVWGIGVPLAFIGAFVFHWPVYAVAALVLTEEIVKMIAGSIRFLSGKWIKDLTKRNGSPSSDQETSEVLT